MDSDLIYTLCSKRRCIDGMKSESGPSKTNCLHPSSMSTEFQMLLVLHVSLVYIYSINANVCYLLFIKNLPKINNELVECTNAVTQLH